MCCFVRTLVIYASQKIHTINSRGQWDYLTRMIALTKKRVAALQRIVQVYGLMNHDERPQWNNWLVYICFWFKKSKAIPRLQQSHVSCLQKCNSWLRKFPATERERDDHIFKLAVYKFHIPSRQNGCFQMDSLIILTVFGYWSKWGILLFALCISS